MFGHPSKKSTCLWLNNLPPLVATNIVEPEYYVCKNGKKFSADYMRGVKRSKAGESSVARSKTYSGIAGAMAEQWGGASCANTLGQKKNAMESLQTAYNTQSMLCQEDGCSEVAVVNQCAKHYFEAAV
jgi:hypothetical protein